MAKFQKGQPRPANAGRKKGSRNKSTLAFKDFWAGRVESEEYRLAAWTRIQRGKAPHLESYILNLCFGKPRETVEHSGTVRVLTELPDDDEGS